MYSLTLLVVFIPLFFSHFFARLGECCIISNGFGSFESVKVHTFLFLLILASTEILSRRWGTKLGKKTFIFLAGSLLFSSLSWILYEYENLRDLFLGVGEKQHGILLLIGLIWYGILLSTLQIRERYILLSVAIGTGVCMAIIALIEGIFGYNIFTGSSFTHTGSWGVLRATSTLGNPNYVAGYLLILIPTVAVIGSPLWRIGIGIILFFGILATQSVVALSLAMVYFAGILFFHFFSRKLWIYFALSVFISIGLIYTLTSDSDKWLSLFSRFILMKEIFSMSLTDFLVLVFGGGPEAIIRYFSFDRTPIIESYFPSEMIIDSSHNIFLDLLAKYGLLSLVLLFMYGKKCWNHLETHAKYSIILGLSFLSLNILIISHALILILVSSLVKDEKN